MEILDFTKIKKSTFPVVLRDKTKLTLINQTKEIADAMTDLNAPKNTAEEAFTGWYQTVALILSRNLEGIEVKASELEAGEREMDIEDMSILVREYDQFCMNVLLGKN